jgi:hypothetical protein
MCDHEKSHNQSLHLTYPLPGDVLLLMVGMEYFGK